MCVLISMRSELISFILCDCWIFVEIINIRIIMHENNKVHKLTAANSRPIAHNQNSQTVASDTDSFGVSIGVLTRVPPSCCTMISVILTLLK